MRFMITDAASFALSFLNRRPDLKIHSIYRKTINLTDGSFLIALQAEGSPVSPLSLITNLTSGEMAALPVTPDTAVQIISGQIIFSLSEESLSCSFEKAQIQNSFLSSALSSDGKALIRRALELSGTSGFRTLFTSSGSAPSGQFLINEAAGKILESSSEFLDSGDWSKAAEALAHLTGLGIGLTPSGDDFLCGVLAGLILAGLKEHPFFLSLSLEIQNRMTSTNDISRAFLTCALSGQFSQPVCALSTFHTSEEVLSAFEAVGHSSGTDTLCGIYYVLKQFPLR
ncbi:DUF2877 domain-containing protein [Ruminococcus sp. OM05-10BH]|nr:DUF2877 domain-containing protein [Ruminococcus sp. OM05-10BH]